MLYRTEDLARWGAGKGSNLLPVEIDENNWEIEGRLQAVEAAAGEAANGIASISVTGSQMTVYLGDGTALGPYTLPTAMIRYRGDWATSTAYSEMDLVTVPDVGIYLVLVDHTSDAAAFDPLAEDGEGDPLYRFLFPMGEAGAGALGDLADVDLASEAPTDGQTIVYSGGTWFPGLPTMGLGDLTSVFPGTPSDGDALTWVAADAAWRSRKSRPSVSDEGSAVVASPTDLNFAGAGVSVADDGDGTVTITIPGGGAGATAVSDEGGQVPASPSDLNFAGAGVSVADDGDGTVTVTIPGGGGSATAVSDEGTPVLAAPTDVNFAGAGVSVADDGDGTVTVTIPGGGSTGVSDEGTQVLAGPSDLNFAGAGVSVTNDGDGTVTITIPGGVAGALGDLSDVTITTPASGQFLRYDGSVFVNAVVDWSDLANKPATFTPASHTHTAAEIDGAAIETIAGTTYTQVAADRGKWKRTTNAGAVTITIDASVNAAEDEITFEQGGTGQITFAAGTGMTLNARGGALKSAGQHAVCGIKFISATEATLFGDITV